MNRDGQLHSLWQDTGPEYQPVNSWSRETTYDALVIGAGITGLTTAVLLQEQGLKCIIAEAHNLCFGTTGGTTAHLNTILDTPYNIVEQDFGKEGARLLHQGCVDAINTVEQLTNKYSIDAGFSRQPAFLIAQDEKEVDELQSIVEASARAGDQVSFVDSIPVPLPFLKAARFEGQGQMHATRYVGGLARAFEANGGVLLEHCVVTGVDQHDNTFTANTSLGVIKAKKVVYATHIPPGINLLHFRCAPYRSYAMAVRLSTGDYPEGLLYDVKDPYHYFRTQEVDGEKYLIVGGYDHKTGHEENTEKPFMELEAYVRGIYDVDSVAYRWSSQYFNAADGLPYIGQLPGADDGVYVGTGYGGNGITLGSLAGSILSDLVMGKENAYAELFRPGRIKPIAGFMDFVKENADVASQFIGKRFAYEKISTLSELAAGEATLADWEGKKVALYKDENGKVHAVDPVCKHAKCIVAWNRAEKTWDCPCHGARYTPQGEMITGPARAGLTPLLWESVDGD
jgi:glycine/D-amino acid oxidase-like deaminating enzyme/nitrite reductase/ring-hydroxylating ferredoxin subunit